jgi:serine/tyrosine/threonine adenylyltransferase
MQWNLDTSYRSLPPALYTELPPVPVRGPRLAIINHALLRELNLKEFKEQDDLPVLSGNAAPPGSMPLAQAYAGHQFGYFTRLGDGRAILLGEHITADNRRYDIQLKGSGRTPYSRNGDGRAALGPMLREYIVSEAMHALGIPTTRSLAVVATGEPVYRETVLHGAILTRVAASHIRVGTFEYAAQLDDPAVLAALADYTIARHYPQLIGSPARYAEFIRAVGDRQATLIAQWLQVGFIHGVMNTDNMAISGETIDYGPCAFMDTYDPDTVFSSIDHHGRYRYRNQQPIAAWNLARLAETLLPLVDADPRRAEQIALDALESFNARFAVYWQDGMRAKLGLFNREDGDAELIDELLRLMHRHQLDYTTTFRSLSYEDSAAHALPADAEAAAWYAAWRDRAVRQDAADERFARMRRVNPAVIPRNHRVEEALRAAEQGSMDETERLLAVLAAPFDLAEEDARYQESPGAEAAGYRTFCGT